MGQLRGQDAGRGWLWFATPLLVCLPRLALFLLGAVLTGAGIGAAGSFLTDNGFLLAILISAAMLAVVIIGLAISRLIRWRGGGMRILSLED